MDELLAAGVYVVQVYNLIISPPLASYLRATRFRPAGGGICRPSNVHMHYACAFARSLARIYARSTMYMQRYVMHARTRMSRRVGVSEAGGY